MKGSKLSAVFFSKALFAITAFSVILGCGTSRKDLFGLLNGSASNEITRFTIISPPSSGIIDESTKSVSITVPYGTDTTALVADFSITGISAKVGAIRQESKVTANDFSSPLEYNIDSEVGISEKYTVTMTVAKNTAKEITSFTLGGTAAAISGTDISVTMPYGTDITNLAPAITHTGESVSPASGTAQNFTNPVTYTVTADDGSKKDYIITVAVAKNSAKNITSFTILGIGGTITSDTVTLTVPYGTDPSALIPAFTITGENVTPASGTAQDFTDPVTYTVTADDGSTKAYTVTVTAALDSAKEITAFSFPGVSGVISGTAISLTVPYGTDPADLTPTITHTGVSVSPASGISRNFSSPVTYTVTAENGSTRNYSVAVSVAPSTSKDITAFTVSGAATTISTSTIAVNVPFGTDITSLTPAITHTGATVSPGSGVAKDFSSAVLYTVTAADGSAKTYTVTVTIAPCSISTLTSLSLSPGSIAFSSSTTAYSLTVSNSATSIFISPAVTNATAAVAVNGTPVTPPSGIAVSLSVGPNVIEILVTAQDLSSTTYTLNVTRSSEISVAESGAADPGSTVTLTFSGSVTFTETRATPSSVGSITFPTGTADATTATISYSFLLGQTEVTYAQWNLIYTWALSNGYTFAHAGSGSGDYPVTNISWRDMIVWCNAMTQYYNENNGTGTDLDLVYKGPIDFLHDATDLTTNDIDSAVQIAGANGFRLPTASEWEFSARYLGPSYPGYGISMSGLYWTPGNFASGAAAPFDDPTDADTNGIPDAIDAVAWYSGNSGGAKHKVAQKAPNFLGLFDMSGNVRDRCFDIAYSTYPGDRGGSYYNDSSYLPVGASNGNGKDVSNNIYGFRIAQTK